MRAFLRDGKSPTCHYVTIGPVTILFSYQTPVAFVVNQDGWVACDNIWGPTTGKHINETGVHKDDRLPFLEFEAKLSTTLDNISLLSFLGGGR